MGNVADSIKITPKKVLRDTCPSITWYFAKYHVLLCKVSLDTPTIYFLHIFFMGAKIRLRIYMEKNYSLYEMIVWMYEMKRMKKDSWHYYIFMRNFLLYHYTFMRNFLLYQYIFMRDFLVYCYIFMRDFLLYHYTFMRNFLVRCSRI